VLIKTIVLERNITQSRNSQNIFSIHKKLFSAAKSYQAKQYLDLFLSNNAKRRERRKRTM
jgi:hypothetical protein